VHTDREIMANGRYVIITNRKEKTCILIDGAIPVDRNIRKKKEEKRLNTRVHRDITNLKYQMYDYSGNNRSHRNSNESL
jgi:hypothetical protein